MPWFERFVHRLARYSQGLQLVAEHGPLSGPVLEYVCKNEPRGVGRIGCRLDRWFLDLELNIGSRVRCHTTLNLLNEILQKRRSLQQPTVILDIAAGTAPYLRALARLHPQENLTIVCHDRNPRQVMYGRELIDAEALPRFTFAVGDAMDEASYLTRHDPDVLLAIHLFPYLPDDRDVHKVIELAFAHLRSRGCFIATTITKAPGGAKYWSADAFGKRPTPRQPEVLGDWLRAAGFVSIDQRYSEEHGFAVIGWKP